MILAALAMLADASSLTLPSAADRALWDAQDRYAVCIADTARRYAKGRESAEAIAEAALSTCFEFEEQVRIAMMAALAEDRMPDGAARQAWSDDLRPALHASSRRTAMRVVIEARLPPPVRSK